MTTLALDDYVIDTLMPDLVGHDRHPSAFVVYLALWRRVEGVRDRAAVVSLRELAEGTGLSKRAVQAALARLVRRKLVSVDRANATAVPAYTVLRPWAQRRQAR